jgi:hypothetical protein
MILALGKARSCREPKIWAVGGLTDLGDATFCQKCLYESCRMGGRIDADSLICSLSHCECSGHTVHRLSQWHLTADWLAPGESDSSQMHSKVSSDWLPSYIKAIRLVLEIFKMAGYLLDRPLEHSCAGNVLLRLMCLAYIPCVLKLPEFCTPVLKYVGQLIPITQLFWPAFPWPTPMRPISFTYLPLASMRVITLHYLLCNQTHPYPITLPNGSGYFQAKPSPLWIPQQFSNLVTL